MGKVKPTVGILGGMGPLATAHFLKLFFIELTTRGVHEQEFPRTIVLNLPVQHFDVTGSVNHNQVAKQVIDGLRFLRSCGASLFAIPCNSVHEFYSEWTGFDVVNIVKASLCSAADRPEKIGVLCSRQTREYNLYGPVMYVNQCSVDDAIQDVIDNRVTSIQPLIDSLLAEGAKKVILGCTELSLIPRSQNVNVIDSAQALASSLADRL